MDKQRTVPSSQQLQQLAQELWLASHEGDWPRLARADAELGRQAARWQPAVRWGAAERQALQQLKASHAQASQKCAAALSQIDQALVQMREGRSRWMAYAESNEWQDEGSAA